MLKVDCHGAGNDAWGARDPEAILFGASARSGSQDAAPARPTPLDALAATGGTLLLANTHLASVLAGVASGAVMQWQLQVATAKQAAGARLCAGCGGVLPCLLRQGSTLPAPWPPQLLPAR